MKKNQKKEIAEQDILEEMLDGTSLADAEVMDVITGDNVCVIVNGEICLKPYETIVYEVLE